MAIAKNPLANIDRAAHELRCGRAVTVDGLAMLHPEFIDAEILGELQGRKARLVITEQRAKMLSLGSGSNFAVALDGLSLDEIMLLSSGKPVKKLSAAKVETTETDAALELARIAQLLPIAVLYEAEGGELQLSAAEILAYRQKANESFEIVAEAPLKLCDAHKASIKAFRSKNGAAEHMAIIIGEPGDEPVIRVHSSCYTGDLLGSLACDCGDQLRGAIKLIEEHGGGIILYLMQEGRGIGLINKLHAYRLQADGLDTVEANEFLGFDDEERSFEPAVTMLKKMGVKKVKLITNNPKKMKELEKLGIEVTERLPMVIRHEHNHFYLDVKSSKSGHII